MTVLRVVEGGVTTYRASRSTIRHLDRDCGLLRRASRVVRAREVDLWPGFVCDRCRRRGGGVWPYTNTRSRA